jgi:cyclopropane fatty-acyl-phospholipid synthase-like methyltransferase
MTAPAHLGGYVAGGDEATWFPELWRWAVNELGVRSVLDIGCGEGHALRYFRELGCNVTGVDGVPQDDSDIVMHDYTWGSHPLFSGRNDFDLVWSCEFLEHLEERHLPSVVPDFQSAKFVMMTHAFPGQAGHHHVNCRDPEYWKGFFAGIGFTYRDDLTRLARLQAAVNESPWNHFVRSGMVFEG